MPRVVFGSQITKHVGAESRPLDVDAGTLGAALHAAFARVPGIQGYVVDEHGRVRKHVAVFVDGELHTARAALDRDVAPSTEIYVLQALSGG